jgi:DNA-binding transcriptional LysR family regulator
VSGTERIDGDLIAALDALLIERNVTRAAERLGMSQPALSARLTRLRELFGDRLFVPSPTGRGVLPTPRALALAPQVSAVLDQMAAMLQPTAFEAATSTATFKVACHENPSVMLAPDLVPRLQRAAPGVRLQLAFPKKERLAELLENGEIDLFIGIRNHGEEAWLSRTLFEDRFVTGQRRLHPRGTGPLDMDAFCEAKHLLVSSEGDPFSGVVDEALAERDRKRHVAISIESYAVAPTIIATSDLICTLPRRFLTRFEDSLDLFEAPMTLPPVEIIAYWHPRTHEDPAHQWFRAELFAAASTVGRR